MGNQLGAILRRNTGAAAIAVAAVLYYQQRRAEAELGRAKKEIDRLKRAAEIERIRAAAEAQMQAGESSRAVLELAFAEIARLRQPAVLQVADTVTRDQLAEIRASLQELRSQLAVTNGTNGKASSIELKAAAEPPPPVVPKPEPVPREAVSQQTHNCRLESVSNSRCELPEGMDTHFFLSHFQQTGSDQVATLELELVSSNGAGVWSDVVRLMICPCGVKPQARMGFTSWCK